MDEVFLLTPENAGFLNGITKGKKRHPKLSRKSVARSNSLCCA